MVSDADEQLILTAAARADLNVVIGLLADMEGLLTAGDIDTFAMSLFRRRFVDGALLEASGSDRDLRQQIADLDQRLRYYRGDYTEIPRRCPFPDQAGERSLSTSGRSS